MGRGAVLGFGVFDVGCEEGKGLVVLFVALELFNGFLLRFDVHVASSWLWGW